MEENGIVKASIFKSHYEAAKKLPPDQQLAFLRAMLDYQFEGKTEEELPLAVDCLMTCILPVLDKEVEAKAGRPECEVSAEEIASKKEELGNAKAVADFYGISERTVYRKLSELPKPSDSVTDSHCQTLTTAKTDKTKEERRMKNEECRKENEERENEENKRGGAQRAPKALQATPAPSPSSNCVLFPQEMAAPSEDSAPRPDACEVWGFCEARGGKVDAEEFYAFYDLRGWKDDGGKPITDWKAEAVSWETRPRECSGKKASAPPPKQKRFVPPTVEEVAAYCKERGNGIDAESFVAFYESKGWLVGKAKMKDWRQAVITWERREAERKAAEARASPQPIYQHWEAPERPELSDEEREQSLAVLRSIIPSVRSSAALRSAENIGANAKRL